MKIPVAPILALSLAGNAALAYFFLSTPALPAKAPVAPAAATAPAATPATAPVVTTPKSAPAATWTALKTGNNLHSLVANLRAAGFPPSVVRAMVQQVVTEQTEATAADNLPFWKQNPGNPEYLAAMNERSTRRREMLNELLGPDANPSASLSEAQRARRYGNLSDDQIDRIESVSRDINDLRTKLYAQRKSGDLQGTMSTQAALDAELHTELAKFLSPAELEQYDMRNSSSGSRVANNIKGIEVSEQEFTELYRLQKAVDANDPIRSGTITAEAMAQRTNAQLAMNEQARTVLGEDRFYDYLKGSDNNYARIAQFAEAYPQITPATSYELMKLEQGFQASAMGMARNASGGNLMDRAAQFTAARQEFQNKVNALIGEEAGKAFVQRSRNGIVRFGTAVNAGPGN